MIAGPEQNADARKRGARIAEFQYGLAARPLYRNAVTVWIATAAGIEARISGSAKRLLYVRPRKARYRMCVTITRFSAR